MIKPNIDPKGIERPESAVARALCLSPNQTLAILLAELRKQAWLKAETEVPKNTTPKLSNGISRILSQAPTDKKIPPIIKVIQRPYLLRR
jgi:hypothetical protein